MAGTLVPTMTGNGVRRKLFTREEIERLLTAGLFAGERWELIDGELLEKMGQHPPHALTIQLVDEWLRTFLKGRLVRVQLPVEMTGEDRDRSVPEPDIAVRAQEGDYRRRHPRGDELRLAVEVADTSAAFDLSRKAELYAKSGIPEYWVMDLNRRLAIVHRDSDGERYRWIEMRGEDDPISMQNAGPSIRAGALLPERD